MVGRPSTSPRRRTASQPRPDRPPGLPLLATPTPRKPLSTAPRNTPRNKAHLRLPNSTSLDTLPPRVATTPRPLPHRRRSRHRRLANRAPPPRSSLRSTRRASASNHHHLPLHVRLVSVY